MLGLALLAGDRVIGKTMIGRLDTGRAAAITSDIELFLLSNKDIR